MNPVNPNQVYTLSDLTARSNQMKLNSLNGVTPLVVEKDVVITEPSRTVVYDNKAAWGGLTWFIIIALVVGLLFFLFRPTMVLSTNPSTGELYLDWGKLILYSLIIALVVVLLIWLFKGVSMGF